MNGARRRHARKETFDEKTNRTIREERVCQSVARVGRSLETRSAGGSVPARRVYAKFTRPFLRDNNNM
jgi:hypothetical protein